MARVDKTKEQLSLVSSTTEQALKLWVISDKVYYSSFSVNTGQYRLNAYDGSNVSNLLTNMEVYNLAKSGLSDGSLYFDGLDFSNNSYTFGTVSTRSPYSTSTKTGVTGTVKTMVYLGEATQQY